MLMNVGKPEIDPSEKDLLVYVLKYEAGKTKFVRNRMRSLVASGVKHNHEQISWESSILYCLVTYQAYTIDCCRQILTQSHENVQTLHKFLLSDVDTESRERADWCTSSCCQTLTQKHVNVQILHKYENLQENDSDRSKNVKSNVTTKEAPNQNLIRRERPHNEGNSKKLLPKCEGPFTLTKMLDHDRYVVQDMKGSNSRKSAATRWRQKSDRRRLFCDIRSIWGEKVRPLKEGEAVFKAGHIILCGLDATEPHNIKSLCLQTSGLSQPPHEIKINLSSPWVCECTCKAGLSGFCKHIVASLIYINRTEDLEYVSCTDIQQKWGKRKERFRVSCDIEKIICHMNKGQFLKKTSNNCPRYPALLQVDFRSVV
ncbi:hypothetical protein NQ317_012972 [Molorchus minor]|uniref:SWIM-type domain-containing protein n=1 Tax=Molorchus minor TaxID=1323400 RepID=A0ABQ9JF64_9CUCU|nr:hypothetical protein NQ317_012972 [Molorchus minor]